MPRKWSLQPRILPIRLLGPTPTSQWCSHTPLDALDGAWSAWRPNASNIALWKACFSAALQPCQFCLRYRDQGLPAAPWCFQAPIDVYSDPSPTFSPYLYVLGKLGAWSWAPRQPNFLPLSSPTQRRYATKWTHSDLRAASWMSEECPGHAYTMLSGLAPSNRIVSVSPP